MKMNVSINMSMDVKMGEYEDKCGDGREEEYEEEWREVAPQVVGMAGLFLLLLLAGTAGAWIWSCRCLHFS